MFKDQADGQFDPCPPPQGVANAYAEKAYASQQKQQIPYAHSTRAIPTSVDDVINLMFSYHPPSIDTNRKYEAIREAAKYFAKVVVMNTPPSADQTSAVRKIREAVMTANAAIALDGIAP